MTNSPPPSPPPSVSIGTPTPNSSPPVFSFDWLRDASGSERKSLIAGGLGWMLDAMDVSLYALVLAVLVGAFGMDTKTAGILSSVTLVASAIGGFLFGLLADRIGRVRSLMASILVYA
ncbi:MAG: MFS transporter, partial [Candidatus Acidiferrum sp.]